MSAALRGLKVIHGSVADVQNVKDTGWLNFTVSGLSTIGTGSTWNAIGNIIVSDGVYSQVFIPIAGDFSNTLQVLEVVTTGIPDSAIIKGVKVRVEKVIGLGGIHDLLIRLVKNGVPSGGNKATTTNWPATDTYIEYGAIDDTWSLTLTGTEVNAADFGFHLSVTANTDTSVARIDHVQMRFFYEEQ